MTAELLNEWVDNQKLDLDYEGSLRQYGCVNSEKEEGEIVSEDRKFDVFIR